LRRLERLKSLLRVEVFSEELWQDAAMDLTVAQLILQDHKIAYAIT